MGRMLHCLTATDVGKRMLCGGGIYSRCGQAEDTTAAGNGPSASGSRQWRRLRRIPEEEATMTSLCHEGNGPGASESRRRERPQALLMALAGYRGFFIQDYGTPRLFFAMELPSAGLILQGMEPPTDSTPRDAWRRRPGSGRGLPCHRRADLRRRPPASTEGQVCCAAFFRETGIIFHIKVLMVTAQISPEHP